MAICAALVAGCDDDETNETDALMDAEVSAEDGGEPGDAATPEPDMAEPDMAEPDMAEPDMAEPDMAEPDMAEPDMAEPDMAEPDMAEPAQAACCADGMCAMTMMAECDGVFSPGSTCMDVDCDQALAFVDPRAEEITDVRAVVRFQTSEPTSCEAQFGPAVDQLDRRATDPNMEEGELAIDHEVPLEDLEPDSMVFWRARATDGDGVTWVSAPHQFRTEMAPPPQMRVNYALPENGAEVTGVSSSFGGMWAPERAFDGRMETAWSSMGDGDDAWVMVDLGQMRRVERFAFRSRNMADGSSIITSVRLVVNGAMMFGPFDTPDHTVRYTFDVDPVMARTVRIEAVTSTGGNTGAREIELLSGAQ